MTQREAALTSIEIVDLARAAAPLMDSDAFAAFYQRSAPSLRAYLARVSGNAALADDLMQEAYLRFLASPSPVDAEADARRYLFRIATNLLRDHWRRPAGTSLEEVPEALLPAHSTAAAADAQAMLGPALAHLRPREHQLLWLAYAEGCTHVEIAEITGLRPASIRLLLFRARRRLARLLRQPPSDRRNDARLL